MTKKLTAALALGAPFLFTALPSFAESPDAKLNAELAEAEKTNSAFVWEGEIEIGYDSIYDSTVPANENDLAYATGEFVANYAFSDTVSIFGGVTFEELEDPLGATGYGFYIQELGLQFNTGIATIQIGKVHPVFGSAWDSAAGFYGAALAEDYELAERVGGLVDLDFADGGVLSLGVFFADNSFLSDSVGFKRTRNSTATGGAGNTGKLNNLSAQWSKDTGSTRFNVGLRSQQAGTGDVSDETGFVAGIGHSFDIPLDLYAEVASFEGYGGTSDDATYATVNAAYAIGEVTLSGTYARRDITSAGVTDMASIAAEYELKNGMTIGGALAWVDDAGTKDKLVGLNLVIPFGS